MNLLFMIPFGWNLPNLHCDVTRWQQQQSRLKPYRACILHAKEKTEGTNP